MTGDGGLRQLQLAAQITTLASPSLRRVRMASRVRSASERNCAAAGFNRGRVSTGQSSIWTYRLAPFLCQLALVFRDGRHIMAQQ